MKKILILSHALELGGAERSLLGLLDSIDTTKYSVDLFLLRHQGELMDHIPAGINLLPPISAYTVLARPMKDTLKEGHILLTAARVAGRLAAEHYAKKHDHTESGVSLEYSHKFTCPLLPRIQSDTEYDLAISFLTPHYFVAEKVRAKRKIAWIHTDYSKVQVDIESELAMWGAYDHIMSISETVTDSFLTVFPSLADKIVLMENILPASLVHSHAEKFTPAEMDHSSLNLLSIGRFCYQKNFDNIPYICTQLLAQCLDVKWYLIGFGGDEALIRKKIAEAHMEQYVIILGKKENPYPYIKTCDLYVQPSRYEGKAVTVREAQMLGKPVAITNYATSASQLEDGMDGVVVPLDNEGCAAGISALLRDPERMRHLTETCRNRDYSNSAEVEKLYQLMEM